MEIYEGCRELAERMYQLFCYEDGQEVGRDALYPVPKDSIFYVIKDGGIPCGFAELSKPKHLKRLFLTLKHRDEEKTETVLGKLFDADIGVWHVPKEFERAVKTYTLSDYETGEELCFDNTARFDGDGSFADSSDSKSLIEAFEINAVRHGECIKKRDFIGAGKYASRLFFIKERVSQLKMTKELTEALLCKGGSVTIWVSGLALAEGVMTDRVSQQLGIIISGGGELAERAETVLSEYGGQM